MCVRRGLRCVEGGCLRRRGCGLRKWQVRGGSEKGQVGQVLRDKEMLGDKAGAAR